jgi:hypothetical protein
VNNPQKKNPPAITTEEIVKALSSLRMPLPRPILAGLSEVDDAAMERITPVWRSLGSAIRVMVLNALTEYSELNHDVDYRRFGGIVIEDSDPDVRVAAIRLQWENESPEHMATLINLAMDDPSEKVRIEAINELGRYSLLMELGNLNARQGDELKSGLVGVTNHSSPFIRAAAIAALAYAREIDIDTQVRELYANPSVTIQVAVMTAMGRTCDPKWETEVIQGLKSDEADISYAAARAAGEIGLVRVVGELRDFLGSGDSELVDIALWALSEIATVEAIACIEEYLHSIADEEDQDLVEAVEDALSSATMLHSVRGRLDTTN